MHEPAFLNEVLIVLGAAALVAALFERFRLPAVLGFLLAGILVGPHGLKLLTNLDHVHEMAEFGVVFLMLTIGLEFSLERVRSLYKVAMWGGSLQVTLSLLISLLFTWKSGQSLNEGLVLGFVITLSSTAIVFKHLMDRGEMETPYGRICFAILIFQDLAVPAMMLVIMSLGGAQGNFALGLGWAFLKAGLFLVGTVLTSKYILFPLLRTAALTRGREVFFLLVIAICLSISFVSAKLGLSMAIGAFLAGLILANTDFGFQLIGEIAPLRHLFVSLFFVSIGLLFDVSFAFHHAAQLAGIVSLVVFVNIAIVSGVVIALGYSPRIAIAAGLLLCQIGEFSFVLIQVARQQNVVGDDFYKLLMSAAFITLFLSPFLFAMVPKVLGLFEKFRWFSMRPEEWNKGLATKGALKEHVILCGYGTVGADLAASLKEEKIPLIVLEMNPKLVKHARKDGIRVIAGDVSNLEVLERSGIHDARAVIVSFSDPVGTMQALRMVRKIRSDIFIAVRTRHQSDIARLYEMDADLVVLEEWEASIQLNQKLLQHLGTEPAVIAAHLERIRSRQEILAEEMILRRGRPAFDGPDKKK